jgi:toxin secretion/phage lysis holin
MWDKIVKGFAAVGGVIAGLLGEWNVMLTLLAIAMVVDYVSGVIVAWAGKSPKSEGGGVSSAVGFQGLLKKAFIILIVLLATLLDRALGTGTTAFQMAAVFYYIANEGISILENAALMGVPFPAGVKSALEAMKTKGDTKPPDDPGNPA